MAKTKLIIFDFDGVIMDSFTLTCKIWDKIMENYKRGKFNNEEQYRDLFDVDWKKAFKKINISGEELDKCIAFYKEEAKNNTKLVKIYPGIPEVLEQLSKDYTLAIVSNNHDEIIREQLKEHGLLHYFKHIFDAEHGLKPEPGQIIAAMNMFNAKPEETVFIGDMDGDITAAKRANLKKAIAVAYGYHNKDKLQHADVLINSPLEIPRVIE